jgi:hypothetical protein
MANNPHFHAIVLSDTEASSGTGTTAPSDFSGTGCGGGRPSNSRLRSKRRKMAAESPEFLRFGRLGACAPLRV